MSNRIVSRVEAPGTKGFYEDWLLVQENADNTCLDIAILDARRAWVENGDAHALTQQFKVQTTGQACIAICRDFLRQCKYTNCMDRLVFMNGELRHCLKQHGYDLSRPEGLPGCAASLAHIDFEQSMLIFTHLCDTHLLFFSRDGSHYPITVDYIFRYDQILWQLVRDNAKKLDCTPREVWQKEWDFDYHHLQDPRELDKEHRGLENIDLKAGIGVLNGMVGMKDFVQMSCIPFGSHEYLLACTDGLSLPGTSGWSELIQFLVTHDMDLHHLAAEIRKRESGDPDFIEYDRCSQYRDATGVLIDLR